AISPEHALPNFEHGQQGNEGDDQHRNQRVDFSCFPRSSSKVNFATNPENGGIPASDNAAAKKATAMIGSRLEMLVTLSNSPVPYATSTAPVDKNSEALTIMW